MLDGMDWYDIAERGSAMAWVALALLGVFRRTRRLQRLGQILLPEPVEQEDVDYLESVKRSTYLRLTVKCVLLLGGLIALFHWTDYLLFWRFGVIVALLLMDAETINVDNVRQRLALRARSVSSERAQQDRMEAAGIEARDLSRDTNERLRRGDIGRGEKALADKATADRIEETGEDSNRIIRQEAALPPREDRP